MIEPDPAEIDAGIEDGEVINPHGMDPQTVLRFVKTVGRLARQGGRGRLRADRGRGDGHRAEPGVGRGLGRARPIAVVLEQIEIMQTDADADAEQARSAGGEANARALALQRDPGHRPAARRRVGRCARCRCGSAACARSSPTRCEFYFEVVSRDTLSEGARAGAGDHRRGAALRRLRPGMGPGAATGRGEGDLLMPPMFRCPQCEAGDVEVVRGTEFEVDSIVSRKGGGRMHRTKVKVTEDALDANSTIADANRARLRPRTRCGSST